MIKVSADIDRFERMETRELLVKTGGGFEAGSNTLNGVPPIRELLVAERKLFLEGGGAAPLSPAQDLHRLERAGNVPARHDVGEGIVVHVFVVFVRPDDVADMAPPIHLSHRARGPEPPCL